MSNSWLNTSIDEVANLRHGYQFRDTDFVEEGIEIVKIGQIGRKGLVDLSNTSKISLKRLKEFQYIRLFNGDVLMALTGATLGKTAIVKNISKPLLQNYRVGHFEPKNVNQLNKTFLYYLLVGFEVQNEILGFINAGAQGNIGKADFERIRVNFPPLPQQQKISKILSTVDNVIEKTESAIAKYQAIKQGLMHDLFTRGIDVNTGLLRPTPQEAPELYKESALGLIPVEWVVEELIDLCSEKPKYGINAAAVEYNNNLPTYFRITDIDKNGNFSKTGRKSVDNQYSNQYYLKKGDVVFARTGATVGKTYLYNEDDGELVYAGFLIKVSSNNNVLNSNFLKFYTETNYYLNWVIVMSQRSGQPGINGAEYGSLKIPTPKILEQEIISERLLVALNKIQTEQKALAKYQQVKAGLLQDLLTGKVEVSVE